MGDEQGVNDPHLVQPNVRDWILAFLVIPTAVANLLATIIGAGIVSMPETMKVFGLLDIVLIFLVGLLTYISITILMESDSYAGFMDANLGYIGRGILNLCVVMNTIATLIVNMILIGDVLCGRSANGIVHVGLLEKWRGERWGMEYKALLVTRVTFFASLASVTLDTRSSNIISFAAMGLALLSLLINVIHSSLKLANGTRLIPRWFPDFTDTNIFSKFCTVMTAYICQLNVHTVRNELENPVLMGNVVKISLYLCGSSFILGGLSGFFLFGDSTLDDVLIIFHSNVCVRIFFVLHFILGLPNNFHVLRLSLLNHLDNRGIAITTIALSGVISICTNYVLISNIWTIFQFVRVTTAVLIGFAFPFAIATWNYRVQIATACRNGWAWFVTTIQIFATACRNFVESIRNMCRNGWAWLVTKIQIFATACRNFVESM